MTLNRWKVLACTLTVGIGGLAVFATPPAADKTDAPKEPAVLPNLTVKPTSPANGADTTAPVKPTKSDDFDFVLPDPIVTPMAPMKPDVPVKPASEPVFEPIAPPVAPLILPAGAEVKDAPRPEDRKPDDKKSADKVPAVVVPPAPGPAATEVPKPGPLTTPEPPKTEGTKPPAIDLDLPPVKADMAPPLKPPSSPPVLVPTPFNGVPEPSRSDTPASTPPVSAPDAGRPAATPPAPIADVSTAGTSRLKMLLRMGDGQPRFEIRNTVTTELLLKVYGEKIELQAPPESRSSLAGVSAAGRVRFTAPGIEGTCDHLTILSATGEVLLKGNIHLKSKRGKAWSELTAEKMVYQIGSTGLAATGARTPVTPASYIPD